jgi:DNA-binding winged helix-turn-helix (wHTH) protein/tetratricopeptide (TPR) repeat protein
MTARYEFEGFRLDAERRQLRSPSGELLDVPARAFDTLVFLLEQRDEIVSKERLMKAVWPRSVVEENNLTQAVSALRRLLGDERTEPRFVLTVPGRGYRFVARVAESAAPAVSPGSSGRLDSVAILPFKSLLSGQDNPALELGMADTLIGEISTLPHLRVSPLGTVRRYAARDQDPLRAGEELGVAAVLEGSIQTQGDRLRVTARLLRVRDGQSLWSGRFDETMSDVFAIQDSITARVSEALRPTLHESVGSPQSARRTHNLSAYQCYIAGLFNQLRRDIDGLPAAVASYQSAIEADPGYVRAWAGLSVSLAVQAVFGTQPPKAVFPRAKQAALHAVSLDPSSSDALGALGHVLVQYERKFVEGEQYYQRALDLDPNNAQLLLWNSINHAHQGRLDAAVEDIRRAIDIEPRTLAFSAILGMLLYYRRSFDEAIAQLQHLLAIEPQFDQARTFLGKSWMRKGRPDLALEHFRARAGTAPGSFGDLACALAHAGRATEAKKEIERLRELGDAGFGVQYDLAAVHAALGDLPAACESLKAALHDHSQLIGFLQVDPAMDALRREPSYQYVFRELYGK